MKERAATLPSLPFLPFIGTEMLELQEGEKYSFGTIVNNTGITSYGDRRGLHLSWSAFPNVCNCPYCVVHLDTNI